MSDETVDIEDEGSLTRYLRNAGCVRANEPLLVRTLVGGVSNKTVLVERAGGEAWVLKQALPKLRVKVDWFSDPSRVQREALGLKWLHRLAPPDSITPLVFEDATNHLLAMAAVPQPHENWKAVLLRGDVEDDHVRQFGRLLGEVHRRASEQASELSDVFDDRQFFESLRVEPYYAYTASQVPEAAAFLEGLIRSTRARRFTLVHGDYSPKNVLVHDGRLVLLDHEVIHWGDGAFDLGFGLTHLLSKAHHLCQHRDRFARAAAQFWTSYAQAARPVPWLVDLEAWAVRHTLGCLLARVAGRSPLEYLDDDERARQRRAVLTLMARPPATVTGLTSAFLDLL